MNRGVNWAAHNFKVKTYMSHEKLNKLWGKGVTKLVVVYRVAILKNFVVTIFSFCFANSCASYAVSWMCHTRIEFCLWMVRRDVSETLRLSQKRFTFAWTRDVDVEAGAHTGCMRQDKGGGGEGRVRFLWKVQFPINVESPSILKSLTLRKIQLYL